MILSYRLISIILDRSLFLIILRINWKLVFSYSLTCLFMLFSASFSVTFVPLLLIFVYAVIIQWVLLILLWYRASIIQRDFLKLWFFVSIGGLLNNHSSRYQDSEKKGDYRSNHQLLFQIWCFFHWDAHILQK